MVQWYGRLALCLPLLAAIASWILDLSQSLIAVAFILSLFAVVRAASDGFSSVLIASGRTDHLARANVYETIVSALFIPALLILGLGIFGIAVGELIATLVRGAFIVRAVQSGKTKSMDFGDPRGYRKLLRISAPLWTVQLIYALSGRLQPAAVSASSSTLGGYFSAGNRFVEMSSVLLSPVLPAVLPMLTASKSDLRKFRKISAIAILFALVMSAVPALALILAGHTIVRILLGREYLSIVSSLPLVALVIVLMFVIQILSSALIALDKERSIVRTVGLSAPLLIFGVYLLARTENLQHIFALIAVVYSSLISIWTVMLYRATTVSVRE
jgi:O-antigen/teichoic acid export membrane protein